MTDTKGRPVSPVNGVPLPVGKPFKAGEEQRERSRKAGKKSVEARRARKTLREELLALLGEEVRDKTTGAKVKVQAAMSSAIIKQALNGNVKAYETIRDTIGEKPVDNVSIVTADFKALDDAFRGLDDDGG